MKTPLKYFFLSSVVLLISCKQEKEQAPPEPEVLTEKPEGIKTPEGMVWIPGGKFMQGAVARDSMAMNHEKPAHPVKIDGFFMDETEVTNAEFKEFIEATGYVTVAEREVSWEEIKKQVPPGTPKPPDSLLQPGSLIFKKPAQKVRNLYDFSQWWEWKIAASWKHPQGPGSSIEGKEDHPVVHVAYEDAMAYAEWAERRLPTEAEWEYAARAGKKDEVFFWGSDVSKLSEMANTWNGEFPIENVLDDGFGKAAPGKSFPPNDFGLYDMAGNVWEFTSDWYNVNYYKEAQANGLLINPKGAKRPYNPHNPQVPEKVIKGGSYLCHASYCSSFRISARMQTSLDSSHEHLGFRTVATPEMLRNKKK
ncbi:formylglycine-generating enzyme family protein [Salinimicrobium gaetbulicola]|uniref:Formylglycine-generating enzyme family protein n=1 Tax=Salinimicrobium gaetbulicola TaxID=999702 RepID=A0ABW3IHT6_9FLAO